MTNVALEKITEIGSRAFETAKHLGEVNVRVGGKLMERQVEAVDFFLQSTLDQVKRITGAKSYDDVMAANAEFAKAVSEKVVSDARAAAELTAEVRDELVELVKGGADVVSLKLPQKAA